MIALGTSDKGFVAKELKKERGAFGKLVSELRRAEGWSQDRLARELEMSKGRIVEIEKLEDAAVHPSTFAKIARAFNMDVPWLLDMLRRAKAGEPFKAPMLHASEALLVPLKPRDMAMVQKIADEMGVTLDEAAEELILEAAERRQRLRAAGVTTGADLANR